MNKIIKYYTIMLDITIKRKKGIKNGGKKGFYSIYCRNRKLDILDIIVESNAD